MSWTDWTLLACYLPVFAGVGLPLSLVFLRMDPRDALVLPLSVLNGVMVAGLAHLWLLHVGGRWLTPVLLVAAGVAGLWWQRAAMPALRPRAAWWLLVPVLLALWPGLRVLFRQWSALVTSRGNVVNFFNATQSWNIGMIRDVAGGLPAHSSFMWPLTGTYHVGGHAFVDLFRVLTGLTPFQANFIVVNLAVVAMGEVLLVWLVSRWFCERAWARLLVVAATFYLGSNAVRVTLVRWGVLGEAWHFGGDEAEIYAVPYISTNVPRMVAVLLVLWLIYIILERLRGVGAMSPSTAVVLGLALGSVYYYKNVAFIVLVPGLVLVAAFRLWRERRADVLIVVAVGLLVGAAIHLSSFSFGGSYRPALSWQLLRSWRAPDGSLAGSVVAYFCGANLRALGVAAMFLGWRHWRDPGTLTRVALLLAGSYVAGFVLADFVTHTVAPEPGAPADSPFHAIYAPAADGSSIYHQALRQFILVSHLCLSVFGIAFLVRVVERDLAGWRLIRWGVVGALVVGVVLTSWSAPRAFMFVQKPGLADPELRTALGAIPLQGTVTVANVQSPSLASLRGHHLYHQGTPFFNFRQIRDEVLARADRQYRLFQPATPPEERARLLAAMGVSHVLVLAGETGSLDMPGCLEVHRGPRYRVCRVEGR